VRVLPAVEVLQAQAEALRQVTGPAQTGTAFGVHPRNKFVAVVGALDGIVERVVDVGAGVARVTVFDGSVLDCFHHLRTEAVEADA